MMNGCHLADTILKYILWKEKFCNFIGISLKYIPKGPINNESALVLVMTWCWTGFKALLEPMMTVISDAMWRFGSVCHFLSEIILGNFVIQVLVYSDLANIVSGQYLNQLLWRYSAYFHDMRLGYSLGL